MANAAAMGVPGSATPGRRRTDGKGHRRQRTTAGRARVATTGEVHDAPPAPQRGQTPGEGRTEDHRVRVTRTGGYGPGPCAGTDPRTPTVPPWAADRSGRSQCSDRSPPSAGRPRCDRRVPVDARALVHPHAAVDPRAAAGRRAAAARRAAAVRLPETAPWPRGVDGRVPSSGSTRSAPRVRREHLADRRPKSSPRRAKVCDKFSSFGDVNSCAHEDWRQMLPPSKKPFRNSRSEMAPPSRPNGTALPPRRLRTLAPPT